MKSRRIWLAVLAVAGGLVFAWVLMEARVAVVTVRFMSRQPGQVVDALYVTLGPVKQHTQVLRNGESERFRFSPDPEFPLVMAFWMGGVNGGWEGPVLRAGQRLEVTLDEEGRVTWKACDWPCWSP
jgi:hypothetical protein